MAEIWRILPMQTATALIYWIIVTLWLAVLITVAIAYWRNPRAFGVTRLLLIVVAVDTTRNLIENTYFGLYFGSLYGLFPGSMADVLSSPSLLIVPKILNALAACVVLVLLLFRWLPLALAERMQAEKAVQLKTRQLADEAEERRRIIDTALDAFIQIDGRGIVLQWSSQAEKMFGMSRSEAIGSSLDDIIGLNAGYKTQLERIARGEENGNGLRIQVDVKSRMDELLTVELSISSFMRQGDLVYNIFVRDLTEAIASENQLRQSQKMEAVGQLTGGVAHDFNNILTVITGVIDIVSDGVADRPDLFAITRMIDDAATRGANLTRHLLAFARKQPLQPSSLDVNLLVAEAGKLLRPTLGERIEIKTDLSGGLWHAFVDGGQLTSAILNLSLNARDAMPNGGRLTLETRNAHLDREYARLHEEVYAGDYVQISISDNGSGIRPEVIGSIFEPFFTTKGAGEGTGLGLSMVYGFVKQSRGHIKVYSEIGEGTTFKLYLPRTLEKLDVAPARPEHTVGGNELVLVVEDDALVRNYVVTQVNGLGYRTLVAANAEEALTAMEKNDVDLLFTDVIMPGAMNGPDLVRKVKQTKPAIKVLYTSGYTENAIIHNGRLDTGVLLLPKPYRRADLARMLRAAIDGIGG
jgi:PAS domain S-box-containing protein